MAAALATRPFDARVTPAQERARAQVDRLRWAVVAMVLLNGAVWGAMVGAERGLIDVHGLANQAWSWGAAWWAAMPQVTITISH